MHVAGPTASPTGGRNPGGGPDACGTANPPGALMRARLHHRPSLWRRTCRAEVSRQSLGSRWEAAACTGIWAILQPPEALRTFSHAVFDTASEGDGARTNISIWQMKSRPVLTTRHVFSLLG